MSMVEDILTETRYIIATNKLGYHPNILYPRSFNEHILHNKFYNRGELLVKTTDKVAVNDYIKQKGYESLLIHNYHITDDPNTIPFDDLPDSYMIKPNQLSGSFIVVENNNVTKDQIIIACNKWLKVRHYGKSRFVWCTSQIKPQIIVQKLIERKPLDYKFHMINNKCAFIQIFTDSMSPPSDRRNICYDTEWNILPFKIRHPIAREIEKPAELSEMISIAEDLSSPFNYVRVDLYNISGKIYFGELTHFPNSGSGKFIPKEYDFYYGKLFKTKS